AQDANQVVKISPAGVLTVIAGSAGGTGGYINGTGTSAIFNMPTDVKTDALGNIYVADFNNSAIRKITLAGAVTTFSGTPAGPVPSENPYLFKNPSGIAV